MLTTFSSENLENFCVSQWSVVRCLESMEHGAERIADLSFGLAPFGRIPSFGLKKTDKSEVRHLIEKKFV